MSDHLAGGADPLIEQIKANPDDDAPRLVWADREGGERGELVVIQCALARGGLARRDLGRLLRREQELLLKRKHEQVVYVRGFVEHAAVSTGDLMTPAQLFTVFPLLKSVFLQNATLDAYPGARPDYGSVERAVARIPPSQIERIAARPSVVTRGDFPDVTYHGPQFVTALARAPIAPMLKALRVEAPLLQPDRLAPFAEIEVLGLLLDRSALPVRGLFTRHPKLRFLSLGRRERDFPAGELEALFDEPRAEQLEGVALLPSFVPVARARRLANLTSVNFDGCRHYTPEEVRELADAPHLANVTDLTIGGPDCTDEVVEILTRAAFAPKLKKLSMRGVLVSESGVKMLLRFPALEELAFQHGTHGVKNEGVLRESIPLVTT